MITREEFAGRNPLGMRILNRLTTFRVDWTRARGKHDPNDVVDYEPMIDREVADLEQANIVSSLIKPRAFDDPNKPLHVLAIDIDIPATLIPSSSPGHHHLYIETKEGIPHHRYMALLHALADAGIIEPGYAQVSIARGHSDLRLPWVGKDDEIPVREPVPAPVAVVPPLPVVSKPAGQSTSYWDF